VRNLRRPKEFGVRHEVGQEPAARNRLAAMFDGENLEAKSSLATYLVTVGGDGWPHSAMISVGELLIRPDGQVRLATWTRSRSTANVRRLGKAVLLIVLGGRAIRARLQLREVASDSHLAYFAGAILSEDADASEYADLRSGVIFELNNRPETLARWANTLDRLRSLVGGDTEGSTPADR
jgi:hypothetical protein